jgi:hypothetical protein
MGQGIMGVIPVAFTLQGRRYTKDLPDGYLDNYDHMNQGSNSVPTYIIKKEVLFGNLKNLYVSINELLGNENFEGRSWIDTRWDELSKFEELKDYLEFLKENSNTETPSFWSRSYSDDIALNILADITVCDGSYKAFLEVYTTLKHLNILFAKALAPLKNPLAKTVRFVIFG